MKASVSPRTLGIAFFAMVLASPFLGAQDLIFDKSNPTGRSVEILGVKDGKIRFKAGPAESAVAVDQVISVKKAAPKAYTDAMAAWEGGNAAQALSALKSVVETFNGLPTPWAERASAALGDIYLANNQIPDAEAAFAAFQKAYPSATALANVGLARLAIEKKNFSDAKTRLQPIVAEAEKSLAAGAGKSSTYGQAYYLMGMVRESEGAYPEALQDYLSTVTIYYEDPAVVAKAQARADALIKDKQAIVP